MKVLVFNSGSSSLKFALFEADGEHLLVDGGIDWSVEPAQIVLTLQNRPRIKARLKQRTHVDAVARVLRVLCTGPFAAVRDLDEIDAVGHRIVHGGERYTSAVRITVDVENSLNQLAELAPLHNPASLEVIRAARRLLPAAEHVAAFDTAFHATLPEAARTYAIPKRWTRDWGIRRFGFHGLSHAYSAARAAEMLPAQSHRRLIIAHLGNGASVSAVRDGVCIDTSMGFTPLDGVVMGSRSGGVDPGILIHLLRHKGFDADRLDHALNSESGLLGISGISSDMRAVLAAAEGNDADAQLAIDVYVHRLTQAIGGMAATLGGVDALVFTAGVGEHSSEIRRRVCGNLAFLGLELDAAANTDCRPDADIATTASTARVLVITAREDLTIVREVRQLIPSREATGRHS